MPQSLFVRVHAAMARTPRRARARAQKTHSLNAGTRQGSWARTRPGASAAARRRPAEAAANQAASGTSGGAMSFSRTVAAASAATTGAPSGGTAAAMAVCDARGQPAARAAG